MSPKAVTRPILLALNWVNHKAPSGPQAAHWIMFMEAE